MGNRDEYPLFIPPLHLAQKGHRHWNVIEAREYREWLLFVMEERIERLTRWLGGTFRNSPSEHLMSLGTKAARNLMEAPFSEEKRAARCLTHSGYALAADMGLLVGKYLLASLPNTLKWETLRGPKSDISYNLPVIKGFAITHLDPIGGSIAEATGIITGRRGPDAWKRIYEFWIDRKSGQRLTPRTQTSCAERSSNTESGMK